MDHENLKNALNKYGYNYIETGNTIQIKLEFSQQIIVDFNNPSKIIISDKLTGWNFLTGMIEMSLKNAMIYNFIGAIIFAAICLFADLNSLSLNSLFLFFGIWVLMWTTFYIVKLESLKIKIVNWIENK